MDHIDSRRAVRKEISLKGSFKIKDDLKYKLHIYKEPIELTLADVGALGCGFISAYYLPKGLSLLINVMDFPILSEGKVSGLRDIQFTARVMSCKMTPTRFNKLGLEFVDIKTEDLDIIKRFVG